MNVKSLLLFPLLLLLNFVNPVEATHLPIWKSSSHHLKRLDKRSAGYHPAHDICGSGTTCADACGAGFEQCAASDSIFHCFNPGEGQKCCGDGTGFACNSDYYCVQDTSQKTWCCPNGMNIEQCAKEIGASGLHSLSPQSAATPVTQTSTLDPSITSFIQSSLSSSSYPITPAPRSRTTVPAGNTTTIILSYTGVAERNSGRMGIVYVGVILAVAYLQL